MQPQAPDKTPGIQAVLFYFAASKANVRMLCLLIARGHERGLLPPALWECGYGSKLNHQELERRF